MDLLLTSSHSKGQFQLVMAHRRVTDHNRQPENNVKSIAKSAYNFRNADTNYETIVEYYLHWITMFEISFSGSSDTNHDSLL